MSVLWQFVRLPLFERSAANLLTEDDVRRIEQMLILNAEAGPVVARTGGVRKLRLGLGGRGKSGGVRVIYYPRVTRERIYLITVYAKNRQDDLTDSEKKVMRQLTAILDQETER